jgi:uncharacterized protein
MKRRLAAVVLALLLAAALTTPAYALVDKSLSYYVADEAGVLSEEIEKKIVASNAALEKACDGAQIVVVTSEYLDGMKSSEYAMALFNNWGVGDKVANNGMLLLLATGENKAWLSVGAGISGSFNGKMVDDYFSRYFWKEFDKGNYETATSDMLEALFSWYGDYYNVSGGTAGNFGAGNFGSAINGAQNVPGSAATGFSGVVFFLAVILIFVFVIIISIIRHATRRPRRIHYGMPPRDDQTAGPSGPFGPGSAGDPGNAAWLGAQLGMYHYLNNTGGHHHDDLPGGDSGNGGAGDGFGGFGGSDPGDSFGFGSDFGGMGDGGGGFSGDGGGRD